MRTNNTGATKLGFIIWPDEHLELSITHPVTIGRNFVEVICALDELQLSTSKDVATPADWQVGQNVIILVFVNYAAAETKFGKFEKQSSY